MNTSRELRICALGVALALAGCAAEASEIERTADAEAGDHADHQMMAMSSTLDLVGPWTVTASDGSHVTVTASTEALKPGPVTLDISVHSADGAARPRTIDLVSPEMPMHGLVRHQVVDGSVDLDIPMEGLWTIYVNLDDAGAAAAEFQFNVPAGEAGGHVHQGGS